MTLLQRLIAFSLAALLGSACLAGEGHDHGEAPGTPAGPALPRFSATSASFELVGVLDGHDLHLWLDRAADNSPADDAHLSLKLDGQALALERHAPGEFEAELAQAPTAGELEFHAEVTAGTLREQLGAELHLHADAPEAAHAHSASLAAVAAWTGGALLVLALLAAALRQRRATPRTVRSGGAQ